VILHVSAVGALAMVPPGWPWIVGGLVLDHAGLALGSILPRSRLLGPNVRRFHDGSASPREVALTFDDGPDPSVTPRVLDMLDDAGCSASFFAIGRRAERFGDIVTEIAARGHMVENHTHGHSHTFAFQPPHVLAREIDRMQETVERLTGRPPVFFRAPAGVRNVFLDPVLHRRRLRLVSWTRRGFDTVERRPEAVSRRLTRGLRPGAILLLHDGSCARDRRGEPVVVEALKRTLDELCRLGLRGVRLPDTVSGRLAKRLDATTAE
jgi:peptidoglycan/xylan/chitin deacetylase (PgdA/CDA1 family)